MHKRPNVRVLLQHLFFCATYRGAIFAQRFDSVLESICLEIAKGYQIKFFEIGTDVDDVHFLVPSVPTYSVTRVVTLIKSLTARELFGQCPEVKKQLWGGEFWSDGYFVSTVGKHGDENMIAHYVKKQGQDDSKLYEDRQLPLFYHNPLLAAG